MAQRECASMCAGYYHYQLHNHDIDMCNEFCDGESISGFWERAPRLRDRSMT